MDVNIIEDAARSNMVAVYGTLRTGQGNNGLLDECNSQGTYVLKGYSLYVMSPTNPQSIPFIVKSIEEDAEVTVELFKPRERNCWVETLQRLDWLEGHPEWYTRELVELHDASNGELAESKVWVYTFSAQQLAEYKDAGRGMAIPTGDWLNPSLEEAAA